MSLLMLIVEPIFQVFDKVVEHFPMLNVLFTHLTFPVSMWALPISFFKFLLVWKSVTGSSWNKCWSVVTILRIFQCFETILAMLGKNWLLVSTWKILLCVYLSFFFLNASFSSAFTCKTCLSIDFRL